MTRAGGKRVGHLSDISWAPASHLPPDHPDPSTGTTFPDGRSGGLDRKNARSRDRGASERRRNRDRQTRRPKIPGGHGIRIEREGHIQRRQRSCGGPGQAIERKPHGQNGAEQADITRPGPVRQRGGGPCDFRGTGSRPCADGRPRATNQNLDSGGVRSTERNRCCVRAGAAGAVRRRR